LSPFSHKIYIKRNIIHSSKNNNVRNYRNIRDFTTSAPAHARCCYRWSSNRERKPENRVIRRFSASSLDLYFFILYFLHFTLFSQINYSIKELLSEMRNDHKEIIKEMRQDTRWMTWIGIFMTLATLILAAAIFWHGFWAKSN
jgi:hypothetical protein